MKRQHQQRQNVLSIGDFVYYNKGLTLYANNTSPTKLAVVDRQPTQ